MISRKIKFQQILDYAEEALTESAQVKRIIGYDKAEVEVYLAAPIKLLASWKSALANDKVLPELDIDFHYTIDIISHASKIAYLKPSELEMLDEYILYTFSKPVSSEGGLKFIPDPNFEAPADFLQPHQRRVVDEHTECVDRIGKLENFIGGPIFSTVDLTEQVRLTNQLTIMKQLRNVLAERIEAFNK